VGHGGSGAGVLTTDAGLTFTGDSTGNILALSTADGATLWHAQTGAPMQTSPITYELDGRQYLVSGSGGVMFAWALPVAARKP
jgi:alcohol dehydrogenase (cytochrome c)